MIHTKVVIGALMSLVLPLPAFGKTYKFTYAVPCSQVWDAVKHPQQPGQLRRREERRRSPDRGLQSQALRAFRRLRSDPAANQPRHFNSGR
jgi:hypothetical protein